MVAYRVRQVRLIPTPVGVYALCDLDEVPVYVGQSTDGIRARVQRHLTSARSDVIANRQIDVWEIAYVWAWPTAPEDINALEAHLFHEFNDMSRLMNGTPPARLGSPLLAIPEKQRIQVMTDEEIALRRHPVLRLPRQAQHYEQLLNHIVNVKDGPEMRLALAAHFDRLSRYHREFLEPDD